MRRLLSVIACLAAGFAAFADLPDIAGIEKPLTGKDFPQKTWTKNLVFVTARLEKTTLKVSIKNCSAIPIWFYLCEQPLSELHIAVREHENGTPARMTKLGAKESEPYSGSGIFAKIAPGASHEWKIDLTKYFVLEAGKRYEIKISGGYLPPEKTSECFQIEGLPLKI